MPMEATPEMEQAAEKYWNERRFKSFSADPRTWQGVYAAMRAAAPAAPVAQAEPVAWYRPGEGGCDSQFRDHATVKLCTGNPWTGWQPLYARPQPAPDVAGLVEALERARHFIRNGIDLGFIRMPDADTDDSAHETLPKIEAALSTYRAALAGKGSPK